MNIKKAGILLIALGLLALVVVPAIAHDADGREHRHYSTDRQVAIQRMVDRQVDTRVHRDGGIRFNCGYDSELGDIGLHFGIGDDDNSRVYFRGNEDLVIRNYDKGPRRMTITPQYELLVNGDPVTLDAEQKELVADFYNTAHKIRSKSVRIGIEGARIGVRGAKLGIRAAAGAFRMLLTDYTEEEFERDIEREADKLEAQAEPLEQMGEEVDRLAERLERLYDKMVRKIPEISESI